MVYLIVWKNWLLVCWWWHFHWTFARLVAPVVTTISIALSSNKILNGDILVPADPGPRGKWLLERRERQCENCYSTMCPGCSLYLSSERVDSPRTASCLLRSRVMTDSSGWRRLPRCASLCVSRWYSEKHGTGFQRAQRTRTLWPRNCDLGCLWIQYPSCVLD